jgi:hypothetical protein
LFIPEAVSLVNLQRFVDEVKVLERDFDNVVRLLTELGPALGQVLGQGCLPPTLQRLSECSTPETQDQLREAVERLVSQGQQPEVVRELRLVTRLTWDEVYALFRSWPRASQAEKDRWVRRTLFRRALRAAEREPQPDTKHIRKD